MYRLIYTQCLEKAEDIKAHATTYASHAFARLAFTEKVREVLAEVLNNEFLHGKADIHGDRAVISVESVRHVVAIEKVEADGDSVGD